MTVAPGTATIRPARPEDVPAIVAMVHELAAFEKAPEQCHLTEPQLHAALFDATPALFGHVAVCDDRLVGYALWFLNFSTWEGVHGLYLEDVYVRPEARGTGAGKRLIAELARICVDRGYARLDLQVLNWNPARDLYTALGFTAQDEWLPYRLTGTPLRRLAR
ncbi:GNAT family N-acetyltransferase [Micromonospora sp. CPCC 206061]|uniref:GNAT family N-acetyltransferase n=1 Tax=Micromonospora sp. CPCC 206061 TaxID=3122410 RepID=UPI002FEF1F16